MVCRGLEDCAFLKPGNTVQSCHCVHWCVIVFNTVQDVALQYCAIVYNAVRECAVVCECESGWCAERVCTTVQYCATGSGTPREGTIVSNRWLHCTIGCNYSQWCAMGAIVCNSVPGCEIVGNGLQWRAIVGEIP